MRRHARAAIVASLVAVTVPAHGQATSGGTIRGTITDKEFGSPVVGATVTIMGTRVRAQTTESGSFTIPNVAPGTYTVIVSKDGYVREVRPDIRVVGGQLTDVEAAMAGEFEDMDEVVVQDAQVEQKESEPIEVLTPPEVAPPVILQPGDFTLRLESPQLLDVVGVETISRSGAGDAAAALLLVPGATLQEGKYAVVRGLPDRYVSVLLDSVRLPVSTPGKRAVQLDQFPAAVIENIQVSKSFTPDLQGEASGGGVNVKLRDIPEEPILQLKAQYGTNSQVKNGSFLTYPGGGLDFWGNNDVLQTYPELNNQPWPNNPTGTTTGNAPPIYKFSGSAGDSWEVDDGVRLGAFGTFFHENGASYFENGVLDTLVQEGPGKPLTPAVDGIVGSQFVTNLYDVTQGTQSVQWGGMGSAGIETEDHKVGGKFIYSRLSESTAVLLTDTRGKSYFWGPNFGYPTYNPNDPYGPGNKIGETQQAPWQRLETLDYTQVTTQAVILNGEHRLSFLGPDEHEPLAEPLALGAPKIDWRVAFSKASENQPDQTQFASVWVPESGLDPSIPFTIPQQWTINDNLVPFSSAGFVQHINYLNTETSDQGQLNIKLPFMQWNDREGYIKAGMFIDSLSREYQQDSFVNAKTITSYEAPWSDPWSRVFPGQGDPMIQSTQDISYNGSQLIAAGYGMIDLPFNETMNLVGGVRYESTDMTTTLLPDPDALWLDEAGNIRNFSGGSSDADADIAQMNWLPMIGWNWNLQEDLVLRTSFAQTLARPNFFEIVPVLQYQYIGGPIFIGNPQLQMSSLNNYDVRLDWTPEENWLISGSVFYKQISQPIQYVQRYSLAQFSYTTPINFGNGSLLGAEVETRVTLDPIFGENFKGLAVGGNVTWMSSQVDLPEMEASIFRGYGVDVSSIPLTATPDYLWNANVTYDLEPWGTQFGLFYNYQGRSMISAASSNANPSPPSPAGQPGSQLTPAIYQVPYGTLNLTIRQPLLWGFAVNFAAKNLTNPVRETQYESFDGFTGTNSSYTAGIDLQFGLTFQASF